MAATDFNTSAATPAYLVVDTETIPDGRLLRMTKFRGQTITDQEAILRAQAEARERSSNGSDFLPVSFHLPVAICVLRVAGDFAIQRITCLGSPHFCPRTIVEEFWKGIEKLPQSKLVTFNGRSFDLPLLEMAAFRFGSSARQYFQNSRSKYNNSHFDILAWFNNWGACRMAGGLDLFSKLLGKPGKMDVSGDQVYAMHQAGKLQEINDYCMFDTLDTYFVFLPTRVLTGDLSLEQEHDLVARAKSFLVAKTAETPALQQYLDNWGDWKPWP